MEQHSLEVRMVRRFSAALALVFVASAAASAQTTLNFDDLVGSGDMPLNYGGISWSADWWAFDGVQPPYTASSGAFRIASNALAGTLTPVETFWDFLSPSYGISAWFAGQPEYPTNPNEVAFNFYYLGFLVHSTSAIGISAVPQILDGSGYAGAVDRVGVYGSRGYYVIDDLSFTSEPTSTVPEPATMTLVATGLAGMAAARRRRKA